MTATPTLKRIDEAREESLERVFQTLFADQEAATLVADETVQDALRQCRGEHQLAQLDRVLGGNRLTAQQKGRIQLARHVLRAYFKQPAFHPDLARALLAESSGLLARALTPGGWLMQHGRDPVHELLSLVGRVGLGWSPGDRRADEARDMLCSWVRAMGQPDKSDQVVGTARTRVADLDQIRERRVAGVRGRNQGLSAAAARRRAAEIINQQLAGRPQPPFMARSLHQDWWPALQQAFMHEGEPSELASRLVRALALIIWALQPRDDVARDLKKLHRVAENIGRDLPGVLAETMPNDERREELIDRIEVALYSIIHGRQVQREPVTPLDETEPAANRFAQESGARPQWFERTADAQRMWLLSDETEEDCLSLDLFGRRVLHGSPEEVQGMLDRQELRPVPSPVPTPQLVRTHLNHLKRRTRSGRLRHPSRQAPPEQAGS